MKRDILTTRQLNRATLARQMLLERSDAGIVEAVRFLGGLQAQQSNDPYIGLWSRLGGFSHEALTALIVDKTLARATTMRGTLHLHTADDLVGFRALAQDFLMAQWKSNFLRRFGSEDKAKVRRAGVRILDKGPITSGDLGKQLKTKFPSAEPLSLSVLLQMSETLVQVPPTRLWGNGSAPKLVRVENWLPDVKPNLSRVDLVRRYLAAYGPA
ncbi:MAG: crosslink repair DNA glycosylase YcaQ family protein, partial [Devosia sp.]